MCLNWFFKNISQHFKKYVIYCLDWEHCHLQSQNETKTSLPPRLLLSNHRPLSSHAAAAGQRHMASRAPDTAGSLTHTPHTQWFISQLELTVSSQEYLKELRILLFQRAFYKLPSRDVLKKENYYFFFYNNYICFKSLYAHDMVICFSAGFSYSVLVWPRFAV